jgi:hypothetical protein
VIFTFFLKRVFVNDVLYALGTCFDEASAGKAVYKGFGINTRAPFMASLERWLENEGSVLDVEVYGGAQQVGLAVHRCRVWVGVQLAKGAYEHGCTDVPKNLIKKFWKPANEVSDHFFVNLRARAPAPFSKSVRENLMTAIDNAG